MPDKSLLRKECLARRQSIGADAAARYAGAIAHQVLPLLTGCSVVGGYAATRGEVELRQLLEVLSDKSIVTALPCVNPADKSLTFRAWKPGDALVKNIYGMEEPPASAREVIPDALLVPLLAFDHRCHRLGYGSGYYDRAISRLRARQSLKVAVGIAYAMQRVAQVPTGPYDQTMDYIVTEELVIPA